MNQANIGKFISELRKEKNMTQLELANKLGITDRAISKWENGRGMPDVSLLEPLCKELNISINELLTGKKIEHDTPLSSLAVHDENTKEAPTVSLSADALTTYSRLLNQKKKRKLPLTVIAVLLIFISLIVIITTLSSNKTFFKSTYCSDFAGSVVIPIPTFSYYRHTGGLDEYTTTLKTLRQPDDVNVFIDDYLRTLEIVDHDGEICYYDAENDFTILAYKANNDGVGLINTIYITYRKGS